MSQLLGVIGSLSWGLAIVAIAGGGLATIVGLRSLQEWFARAAVSAIAIGLAVPVIQGGLIRIGSFVSPSQVSIGPTPDGFWIGVPVVVGHVVLLVILWRRRQRRLGRSGGARSEDLTQVRGRRRARLSLDGDER
jgi:hypothetical protein